MQKVETYYDMLDAATQMKKHIRDGWRVHTCAMGSFMAGYNSHDHILVIYEKEG
jgi:hypothetical protein